MPKKLILASGSPRRKELLQDTGLVFEVMTAECDEFFDESLSTIQAIEKIAYQKASVIFDKHKEAIVIGADTMVCFQNHILGKPKDKKDAYRMLSLLSGNTHKVITSVVIVVANQNIVLSEETSVQFFELTEEMIAWYLSTSEPYDKAGAYGIQGKGKLLVKGIQGDYYNVVGLPVAKVYRELLKLGI